MARWAIARCRVTSDLIILLILINIQIVLLDSAASYGAAYGGLFEAVELVSLVVFRARVPAAHLGTPRARGFPRSQPSEGATTLRNVDRWPSSILSLGRRSWIACAAPSGLRCYSGSYVSERLTATRALCESTGAASRRGPGGRRC
jgi:hypothetical protein